MQHDGRSNMKKNASRLRSTLATIIALTAVCSATISPIAAACAAELNAPAAQEETISPRAMNAQVVDTYMSFSTANDPSENIDRYNETYKLIYFQNSYALTGTQIIYTSLGISPNNPFVVGFETKYRCIYDTW